MATGYHFRVWLFYLFSEVSGVFSSAELEAEACFLIFREIEMHKVAIGKKADDTTRKNCLLAQFGKNSIPPCTCVSSSEEM